MECTIEAPFQMRRRGVELKCAYGRGRDANRPNAAADHHEGRSWLAMVISGKPFPEIADIAGIPKRRVQDVMTLELLVPNVLDGIASGGPEGLTTDDLIKTRVSSVSMICSI